MSITRSTSKSGSIRTQSKGRSQLLLTKSPKAGVLGTILTDLEFGEEEQSELQALSETLSGELESLADIAVERARLVAYETEGIVPLNPLGTGKAVRPSLARLRRRAAQQWLKATLSGQYDSYFSKQVRNSWLPILLAEDEFSRQMPAITAKFLDFIEAYIVGWLYACPLENFVPPVRMAHGLHIALEIQRRLLGVS